MEDLTTESKRLVKTSMAKNTWLTCKAAFESFNQRKQQQGTDDEVIKQWGCKYIYISIHVSILDNLHHQFIHVIITLSDNLNC